MDTQKTIILYKPLGMTPLETIRLFQEQHHQYQNKTLSYAGRLDPMAEGILLVLIDEENKNRKAYEAFDKTYEIKIILGIVTDSYDMLGLPKIIHPKLATEEILRQTNTYTKSLIGKHQQAYPPFSSKPVKGKPLYYWARKNLLEEISLPTKEISIKTCTMHEMETISAVELKTYIEKNIKKVQGDFRQEQISEAWKDTLLIHNNAYFSIVSLAITCSSGTYMRSIAHDLGKKLKIGGSAFSIKRTRIGNLKIEDAINLKGV